MYSLYTKRKADRQKIVEERLRWKRYGPRDPEARAKIARAAMGVGPHELALRGRARVDNVLRKASKR